MNELDLNKIKLRRTNMRFTLKDMASTLGFKNASTYYKYENGMYKFKAEHMPLLATKLKFKLKDIFLAA